MTPYWNPEYFHGTGKYIMVWQWPVLNYWILPRDRKILCGEPIHRAFSYFFSFKNQILYSFQFGRIDFSPSVIFHSNIINYWFFTCSVFFVKLVPFVCFCLLTNGHFFGEFLKDVLSYRLSPVPILITTSSNQVRTGNNLYESVSPH
jgi:hypothetical protein